MAYWNLISARIAQSLCEGRYELRRNRLIEQRRVMPVPPRAGVSLGGCPQLVSEQLQELQELCTASLRPPLGNNNHHYKLLLQLIVLSSNHYSSLVLTQFQEVTSTLIVSLSTSQHDRP